MVNGIRQHNTLTIFKGMRGILLGHQTIGRSITLLEHRLIGQRINTRTRLTNRLLRRIPRRHTPKGRHALISDL